MAGNAQAKATLVITARDETSKKIGGVKKSVLSFANVLKGAALAGVVAFGVASVKMAAQAEEAAGKFDKVFGPAAKGVGDELDIFAEKANRSSFALREMAANVGGLLEPMLGSKQAAADMSVDLVKLATDLGSFNNVAEKDALVALRAGLIGSSEPMLAFGVDVRDAAVQTEILASGMAKTKSEVTEAMKVQARFNIIMKQTATAQGDAIDTSGSFTNQMLGLKASFEEAAIEIGTALIPLLKTLMPIVKALAGPITALADVLAGVSRALTGQMLPIDEVVDKFQQLADQGIITADEMAQVKERIEGLQGAMAVGAAETEVFASDMREMGEAARSAGGLTGVLGTRAIELSEQFRHVRAATKKTREGIEEYDDSTKELAFTLRGPLDEAIQSFAGTQFDLLQQQKELIQSNQTLVKTDGELIVWQTNAGLSAEELREAELELQGATQSLAEAQQTLAENTDPEKQLALQVAVDKAAGAAERAAGAFPGFGSALRDNIGAIGENMGALVELNTAIATNRIAFREATQEKLFNMALEQAAVDGLSKIEQEALLGLAKQWGLTGEASGAAAVMVLGATQDLAEDENIDLFKVRMGEALAGVVDAADAATAALFRVPRIIPIEFRISSTGQIPIHSDIPEDLAVGGVREHGGPVNRGGVFLVGERGPELFVPGQNGNIVSNRNMKKGAGGDSTQMALMMRALPGNISRAVRDGIILARR